MHISKRITGDIKFVSQNECAGTSERIVPRIASYQKDWFKTLRLKQHGLTLEAYEQMRKDGCGICGASDRLHMDHNHATGKFRGLLCSNHNLALGLFQDNLKDLQAAINYLRRSN